MFDLITSWIAAAGPLGVFGLMLLENLFPPIPSELVVPLAGYKAAQGEMSMLAILIAGTAGSVIGALPWYWAGRWLGQARLKALTRRFGVWMTLDEADIDGAALWFDRYGKSAVFFGRMLPAVRTLISVPAGLVAMPMIPCLILTTFGSLIWTGLLAAAGFVLQSQYDHVQGWLDPVTTAIVVSFIALYALRLAQMLWRRGRI